MDSTCTQGNISSALAESFVSPPCGRMKPSERYVDDVATQNGLRPTGKLMSDGRS
jgi:hypothetical protein